MTPIPATRIIAGATDATLSHQFVDMDGDAAAPNGAVTVTVTRSAGTAVTTGAVAGTTTAPRTVTVGIAELTEVDWLTAAWADGGTVIATETTEVVGGVFGSLAAIAACETSLTTASSSDAANVRRARRAAEDTFLHQMHRSPVPRFYRERVDGTGTAQLLGATWPDLLGVLWARIWTSDTAYTDLTASELAAIPGDAWSRFQRTDGGYWPYGRRNIEVGYKFGLTSVPTDLFEAMCRATRIHYINAKATGVPSGVESYTSIDGIAFRPTIPGQRKAVYRDDDINAVYARYADPRPGMA